MTSYELYSLVEAVAPVLENSLKLVLKKLLFLQNLFVRRVLIIREKLLDIIGKYSNTNINATSHISEAYF